MERWLITGANGFLGYRVGNYLTRHSAGQGDASVFGMVRSNVSSIPPGVQRVVATLDVFESLEQVFRDVQPTHVIHLAAMTRVVDCESAPELSWKCNVEAAAELSRLSAKWRARFVFASTDMVFDGVSGPYDETADTHPINVYGEHKVAAEQRVLADNGAATVCRLPWMFGVPTPDYRGHYASMILSLLDGVSVRLFDDEVRTPLGTATVAAGLVEVARHVANAVPPILHFAGGTFLDRYTIGKIAVEALELDDGLIERSQQASWESSAGRPPVVEFRTRYRFGNCHVDRDIVDDLRQTAKAIVDGGRERSNR